MQPYSNPTIRKMEEYLNIFENGRRPQFFWKNEDNLNFFEMETYLIFLEMEDNHKKNNATKNK